MNVEELNENFYLQNLERCDGEYDRVKKCIEKAALIHGEIDTVIEICGCNGIVNYVMSKLKDSGYKYEHQRGGNVFTVSWEGY